MEYKFYGWEGATLPPVDSKYEKIKSPQMLYDFLSDIWCSYTCAPRLRDEWSEDNKTLGQCSITAFLAQDIFGGKVYGILRPGGNYHCYNVIGDVIFDLTSEQFGDEKLDYSDNPEQFREVHFEKTEKKERYEYLKEKLNERLK
jgi:hypothetical protein